MLHFFPLADRRSPSLTTLLAEDEEELCSRLFDAHVHVGHETDQLVSDGGADLWPDLHIFQWGKYLRVQRFYTVQIDFFNFHQYNLKLRATDCDYTQRYTPVFIR